MAITNFVRAELNRVLYGELADTIAGFEEVLSACIFRNCKNEYISNGDNGSLVSSSPSHHWKSICLMV